MPLERRTDYRTGKGDFPFARFYKGRFIRMPRDREMKFHIACVDQERLWMLDNVSGDVYSVHLETLEAKCEIDFWRLPQCGQFMIQALLAWKKDYIVIIPFELDRDWILYDKRTGGLESRKVLGQTGIGTMLVAEVQDGCQLIFSPENKNLPVCMVDRNSLQCTHLVENWYDRKQCGSWEIPWVGACNGRYVFYPQRNGKTLLRIDCGTQKADWLELPIPEGLAGMDYAFGELWVLPAAGNRLYQIDEDGSIIDTAELSLGDTGDAMPCFGKIVAQERYLFLLPCFCRGIYVYDKQKKKTHLIAGGSSVLEGKKYPYMGYWGHCVRGGRICFLPLHEPYIEIDLSTLAYVERTISCPDREPDTEGMRERFRHISAQEILWAERGGCNLDFFSKYIRFRTAEGGLAQNVPAGRGIWNLLMQNEMRCQAH